MHPDYQRNGVGKMLVNHCLDLADAEGKKAFLGATEEGVKLYSKCGFRQVEDVKVDVTRWGGKEPAMIWPMVRDPKTC